MITKQQRRERRERYQRCLGQYGLIASHAYLDYVDELTSWRKQQQREDQRKECKRLDGYDLILPQRYGYMAWMKTMRKLCDTVRMREWCVTTVVAVDTSRMTVERMMGEWQYQDALMLIRDLGLLNQLTAKDISETFTQAHQLSGYHVGMTVAQKRARVVTLSSMH